MKNLKERRKSIQMTAQELFAQQMLKPAFKEWYESRPPAIQELARNYPFDTYIMKEGAPYGLSCHGQIVHLHCYTETPSIKVVVMGVEKIQAAKQHEVDLYIEHNVKQRMSLQEIHNSNVVVEVDPIWLEPITEPVKQIKKQ